jgi:hypothetical protein
MLHIVQRGEEQSAHAKKAPTGGDERLWAEIAGGARGEDGGQIVAIVEKQAHISTLPFAGAGIVTKTPKYEL